MSKKSATDKTVLMAFTFLDEKIVKIKRIFSQDIINRDEEHIRKNNDHHENGNFFFISRNKEKIIFSFSRSPSRTIS